MIEKCSMGFPFELERPILENKSMAQESKENYIYRSFGRIFNYKLSAL
jgi:hypothetical protein